MGFLDKAKAAAEQAAAKAKEGVEDVQTKRELSQAYNELGKSDVRADRERGGHEAALRCDRSQDPHAASRRSTATATDDAASAEPYDASQPPAMPT